MSSSSSRRTEDAAEARGPWIGLALAALALVAVAFGGGLAGGFVWDDHAQIVQNRSIQEGGRVLEALGGNVWAFEGEGRWGGYWRPVFVAWLIACHRAFGLDPFGWHAAALALHAAAVIAALLVLRRLRYQPAAAALALFVFAVHPAQVEAVAWVSGAANALVALLLLASLEVWLARREGGGAWRPALSLVLYALALGSKESAVLWPALVALLAWQGAAPGARARAALVAAWPFAALALLFLGARAAALAGSTSAPAWAPGLAGLLASLPEILAFYLRRIVWPFGLSPLYPLRPLEPGELGLATFVLPLCLVLVVLAACALAWRRVPRARPGLALATLTLLPSLNVAALSAERIAHDRYLYLPLLGVGLGLAALAERLPLAATARALAAGALGALLALLSAAYAPVWSSGLALWERAAEVDPRSAYARLALGEEHQLAGRIPEAEAAFRAALALDPRLTQAHLWLGANAARAGRADEALAHLEPILRAYPAHQAALEHLALAYATAGRQEEALALFRAGRERLPAQRALYTLNAARLLVELGRDAEALRELGSIEDALERGGDPRITEGLVDRARVQARLSEAAAAAASYRLFLSRSASGGTARTPELRAAAERELAALASDG